MAFTAYTFTDTQLTDIRRFCGFGMYGDGSVVGGAPWMMTYYLALEYKLQHMSTAEGAVVVARLADLNTLEAAIPAASSTLNVAQAGPFTRNANEIRDRMALFNTWRRELCAFLMIQPGPGLPAAGGIKLVV